MGFLGALGQKIVVYNKTLVASNSIWSNALSPLRRALTGHEEQEGERRCEHILPSQPTGFSF